MISLQRDTPLTCLLPASRPTTAAMLQAVLEVLGLEDNSVELLLTDDRGMARFNSEFLDLDGPTNVLAFPSSEGKDLLGQIVLNVDMLRRESLLYGQDPVEHLARLLSHAALHLAGHDHGPIMEELTEAAMEAALKRWALLEVDL